MASHIRQLSAGQKKVWASGLDVFAFGGLIRVRSPSLTYYRHEHKQHMLRNCDTN